jgi:hypothetical protein
MEAIGTTVRAAAVSTLCVALAAAQAAAQISGVGPERRVVEVSGIYKIPQERGILPAAPPLRLAYGQLDRGESRPAVVRDLDVKLLLEEIPRTVIAGARVERQGNRLVVWSGERELNDRAARIYADVVREYGGTSVFRLALVDEPPPRPTLTAAETEAFLAAHPPRFSASTVAPGVGDVALRAGRDLAFVADVEAFGAGGFVRGVPRVGRVALGLSATVSASETPEQGYLLRVAGVHARLLSLRRVATGADAGSTECELPEVASVAVCGAAVVEDGGAFVVGASGDGGNWIATARRTAARSSGAERRVVNASALTHRSGRLPLWRPDEPWRNDASPVDDAFDVHRPIERQAVYEAFYGSPGGLDLEKAPFLFTDSGLLIFSEGGTEARARGWWLASAAEERLRNAVVELRHGVVPTETPLGSPPAEAGWPDALPGRMYAAALSGEPFRVVTGVERGHFAGAGVRIEGGSTHSDPVATFRPFLEAAFEGVGAEGVLRREKSGGVDVSGVFYRVAGGTPEAGPRMADAFPLTLSRPDLVRFEIRGAVERDVWRVLGAATVEGGTFVLIGRARD